jgi:hypothetical protein
MNNEKAAKLIKQQFSTFRHMTVGAIRQRLPEARKQLEQLRTPPPPLKIEVSQQSQGALACGSSP